jgi:hypothetical protein
MNKIYFTACVLLFLVTAPALLGVRLVWRKGMPWWMLLCLSALLGWALSNLAVYFYYRHLDDLLAAAGGGNTAPQELMDTWQSDGAKQVFAFLCGWLYGLFYLTPWLAIYCVVVATRNAMAKRRSHA